MRHTSPSRSITHRFTHIGTLSDGNTHRRANTNDGLSSAKRRRPSPKHIAGPQTSSTKICFAEHSSGEHRCLRDGSQAHRKNGIELHFCSTCSAPSSLKHPIGAGRTDTPRNDRGETFVRKSALFLLPSGVQICFDWARLRHIYEHG